MGVTMGNDIQALLVTLFFTNTGTDENPRYELNERLPLLFNSEQESAQFLVECIRYWHGKSCFFCCDTMWEYKDGKQIDLPEDEWEFRYLTDTTCRSCVRGQKILDKIFAGKEVFNSLPFVVQRGDREHFFSFELLKFFAKNGHDETVRWVERRKAVKNFARFLVARVMKFNAK